MQIPANRTTPFLADIATRDGRMLFGQVTGRWNKCNRGERGVRRGEFEVDTPGQPREVLGENLVLRLPTGVTRTIVVVSQDGRIVRFRSRTAD